MKSTHTAVHRCHAGIHAFAKFLGCFFADPRTTGAIMPSSRALAKRMVEWLDLPHAMAVVEYGAGTGSFTRVILDTLPSLCRFFTIEVNPELTTILRRRFPGAVIFEDNVQNVRKLCDHQGIQQVDCVISGLPWASFAEDKQVEYLDATMKVLKPNGQFVTFAYLQGLLLPNSRRFRRLLDRYFSGVSYSRTVWMNLPPAFVYRCRR